MSRLKTEITLDIEINEKKLKLNLDEMLELYAKLKKLVGHDINYPAYTPAFNPNDDFKINHGPTCVSNGIENNIVS